MQTIENNILFINEEDVKIEKAKDIKLSELKTGQPRFFQEQEGYCDLYMISRVHINKTDFILTPLWGDEKGFYHSKEGSNTPARQDFIVPMNHNVFRNWLSSPLSEYADSYSEEESPNDLTAAHVYSFCSDSNYIHSPETKYSVEFKNY